MSLKQKKNVRKQVHSSVLLWGQTSVPVFIWPGWSFIVDSKIDKFVCVLASS